MDWHIEALCGGYFYAYHPISVNSKAEAQKDKSFIHSGRYTPLWRSLETHPARQTVLNLSVNKHSSLVMDPRRFISVCLDDEEEINSLENSVFSVSPFLSADALAASQIALF